MERDNNAEKGRQVRDAYSKNKPQETDKNHKDNSPQPPSKNKKASTQPGFNEKSGSDSTSHDKGEHQNRRENRQGADEDFSAQEGGSYGHKSQEDAEKDGRGEREK